MLALFWSSELCGAQILEHEGTFKKIPSIRGCTIHTPVLEMFPSVSLQLLL